MTLQRFLSYFLRAQAANPAQTTVRFAITDREFLSVQSVEFDVASNTWTVRLVRNAEEKTP